MSAVLLFLSFFMDSNLQKYVMINGLLLGFWTVMISIKISISHLPSILFLNLAFMGISSISQWSCIILLAMVSAISLIASLFLIKEGVVKKKERMVEFLIIFLFIASAFLSFMLSHEVDSTFIQFTIEPSPNLALIARVGILFFLFTHEFLLISTFTFIGTFVLKGLMKRGKSLKLTRMGNRKESQQSKTKKKKKFKKKGGF